MQRLTLTVSESATILGISRTTAYELVRTGTLPCLRLGRRIVIARSTIEELVGNPLPDTAPPSGVVREIEDERRPRP